jgi:hypothetical protein
VTVVAKANTPADMNAAVAFVEDESFVSASELIVLQMEEPAPMFLQAPGPNTEA